jgi:hypothetical protein
MNTLLRKRNWISSVLIAALLGCCAALTLSSCSKKTSVAIIGKWQGQDIIEFRKDGKFINYHDVIAGPSGTTRIIKQETDGKYVFTDANHINLRFNPGGISIRCEVHIHGNQMDMTMILPGDSQQQKVNLKRLE